MIPLVKPMELIEFLNGYFQKILWDCHNQVCMIASHYDDLHISESFLIRSGKVESIVNCLILYP